MNWKVIQGYDGYYEVSDTGLVRSLDRFISDSKTGTKHLKGSMMKQTISTGRDGTGYYVVNLHKNHRSFVSTVHRLVAETFIENPDNLPTVNHKDGDKHNNNVANLEWASYAENNIHALLNELRHPRGNEIAKMIMNGNIVARYKSACEASRLIGIGRSSISHCLNGRSHSAGGFMWRKMDKCNDYLSNESTTEDELPPEALGLNGSSEDIV